MKHTLALLVLLSCFSSTFAYSFGGIGFSVKDGNVIQIGEKFDIFWSFTIMEDHYNDPHPAMTIPMHLYLSKDAVFDSTDTFLASDNSKVTEKTSTKGESTYGITLKESDIEAGSCYLILLLDPNDEIPDSEQDKNFDTYKILMVTDSVDAELQSTKILGFCDPAPLPQLAIETQVMNTGTKEIKPALYTINIANSEAGLDNPLFSFNKVIDSIPTDSRLVIIQDTVDFSDANIAMDTFYVRTTIESTDQTEQFSTNNSKTTHMIWEDMEKLNINYDYVFMASGQDTLTSCSSFIIDDGGETGNYSPNIDGLLVIYPTEPDTKVELTIDSLFYLFSGDVLTVYGNGTANTEDILMGINNFTTKDYYTLSSTSEDGSMAIRFRTNSSNHTKGFKITQGCASPEVKNIEISGCEKALYNGYEFDKSIDTVLTYNMDSIINLYVTVNQPSEPTEIDIKGENFIVFEGTKYFSSEDITADYKNIHGCDSSVTYHLLVTKTCEPENYTENVVECKSATIAGQKITESKSIPVTYTSFYGCDSTVTYNVTILENPQVDLGDDITDSKEAEVSIGITSTEHMSYEWESGEYTAEITITENGTYILTATNLCGNANDTITISFAEPTVTTQPVSTNTATTENEQTTTIDDLRNGSLKIVAATGVIKVSCEKCSASLFDTNSHIVFSSAPADNHQILTEQISSGIYYLSIQTGNQTFTEKLFIK